MQIEVKRPHPDYPFVWVHIRVSNEARATPKKAAETDKFLADVGITLLGKWEAVDQNDLRAPALLEEEHTKPPKKRKTRAKK
jgi:hypothetical protein